MARAKKETQNEIIDETTATEAEAVATPAKAEKQPKAKGKQDFSKMTHAKLWEEKKAYFEYRMALMSGKERNSAKLKQMRRDIARATQYLNLNNK